METTETLPAPVKRKALRRRKIDDPVLAQRFSVFSPKQQCFLKHLAGCLSVAPACRAVPGGLSRRTVYNWVRDVPGFKEAMEDAVEDAVDTVEGALHKQARDHKGHPLAKFGVLKAYRPEKYDRGTVGRDDEGLPSVVSPLIDQDQLLRMAAAAAVILAPLIAGKTPDPLDRAKKVEPA